jgi:Raf kinase inhibitor-like YbhB/YbcL family protein
MRAGLLATAFAALATSATAMVLTSQDLTDGAPMPVAHVYTRCGGRNVSPQLKWTGSPKGTRSFVLTMIDLSVAPNDWSHWIVVGLPLETNALPRGAELPAGARALRSDFGEAAYDGPCPPAGTGVHRYEITVWAMGVPAVTLDENASAKALEATLKRTSLDHASITVTAQTP